MTWTWSRALRLSEKANMNYREGFTLLFWLSFLAAGGIPTTSPWKPRLFLPDSLCADNSVQQQHLLCRSPPPALAALGLYSGHLLPLPPLLPHREGTSLLVKERIQHTGSCSVPCTFSVAVFWLFDLWVQPMAFAKPRVSLCWRTVFSHDKPGGLSKPAGHRDLPSWTCCAVLFLCWALPSVPLLRKAHGPPWLHRSDRNPPSVLSSLMQPKPFTSRRYRRGRA